ncbi:uncharacterized membrane protein YheB (UPF0754 family) [Salirhabdus euzebyi]|uniref:Uncharacterized membrane protein YheB (UPF0754 family) n=1 Tax=Salirhabdus euzebyi TaxID=394506 RepID=A0A841Q8L3_9BACI|nr:DUF445 family protein [Salirhabdus euzebyi]MBB6454654.1 uncharacterized membrane protein YheB (UPF0754 family) [Salirhabdus euzebyi]
MEVLFVILFMIIIGAVIGGLTNSLAIKMLFRPYEAKYIGTFKIPFTPGLIPKRQSELAEQMGKTVVEHLLTPEGIRRKIQNDLFYEQSLLWLKDALQSFVEKDITVEDIVKKLNLQWDETAVKYVSEQFLMSKLTDWMSDHRHHSLKSILPDDLINKGEEYIPQIGSYALHKIDGYLSSDQGKEKIGEVAEKFLGGRGFFGNMISSFLGGDGLADKIQPALSQYLRSNEAKDLVIGLLKVEWDKLLQKEIKDFEPFLDKMHIKERLVKQAIAQIPFESMLQTKMYSLYSKYAIILNEKVIPTIVQSIQSYLTEKIEVFMHRLNLQDIVKEEVENFDVKRLESMVLGISKRELKMITYLGAVLGGVIGFVQGLVVLLIS